MRLFYVEPKRKSSNIIMAFKNTIHSSVANKLRTVKKDYIFFFDNKDPVMPIPLVSKGKISCSNPSPTFSRFLQI